jgi:hypothetical protein
VWVFPFRHRAEGIIESLAEGLGLDTTMGAVSHMVSHSVEGTTMKVAQGEFDDRLRRRARLRTRWSNGIVTGSSRSASITPNAQSGRTTWYLFVLSHLINLE